MKPSLNVDLISDDELSSIATSFLKKYGKAGQSPVDIEKLCDDENVGLLIVPNLTSMKNTEAYITNKCEVIVIDQEVFETQIDRARFSIAHELSHRILHTSHLEQYPINDPESYQKFHEAVSDHSLTVIEDQAYSLAGHLLMPTDILNREINRLLQAERTEIISNTNMEKIIRALAAAFIVSVDAMLRQIKKVNELLYRRISPESLKILVPPYIKPTPAVPITLITQ